MFYQITNICQNKYVLQNFEMTIPEKYVLSKLIELFQLNTFLSQNKYLNVAF